MKHPFETWLEKQNLKQAEQVPFNEAFLCYKIGANRAALLFSYIGFITILKHRVIKAKKPDGYEVNQWIKQVLDPLNQERLWESTTYDLTQMKGDNKKKPVFNISSDIREQIKYWKDRRNDCAHYKDNIIESYHIESFWAFLQSNLNKITVEGGISNLLKKFEDFFDETKTAPSTSIEPLIKEIPKSVEGKDYELLWESIFDRNREFNNYHLEEAAEVANSIFIYLSDHIIVESLVEFLKNNKEFDEVWFIKYHPEHFLHFSYTPEEIRELWKVKLHEEYPYAPFKLFTYLIRNSFIPFNERDEAIDMIIETFEYGSPSENDLIELDKYNFKKKIRARIDDWMSNGFDLINSKASLIVMLIENEILDKELIALICNNQNLSYPSFSLRDKLQELFRKNPEIHKQFKDTARKNSIVVPKHLEILKM